MNKNMAINAYISTIVSKKKKTKQAEQKQNHRYRQHVDGFHMGPGSGEWLEKLKGLRSTHW